MTNSPNNKINVLYVASCTNRNLDGDNLLDAFRLNESMSVDYLTSQPNKFSLLYRIFFKLKIELDAVDINNKLIQAIKLKKYNVIFIVKGNNIYPKTLNAIKSIDKNQILVSYSGDNMSKWHNKSLYFHLGIKYYDIIFSVNIPSYRNIEKLTNDFQKIIYLDKSYSKRLHRPLGQRPKEFKYQTLFIGSYEQDRALLLEFISSNGIEVSIFGNGWEQYKPKKNHVNMRIYYQELTGEDYVSAIFNAKITLGFLRKINEDTQTSRSFEIPACGGFMLMERTDDHIRLFTEGEEAEFFSSQEELLFKIRYYLKNQNTRERIAEAGRLRCLNSGYSFDDVVNKIVSEFY